ncbi:MAG TPA: flagellar hook-length control protein FliK [Devosia sp.]|nr:flagellar hook-length control protein FliK [Devosia sp.]
MSSEATLSHLTVSYVTTPASTTAAAASTAAPVAMDSPLGFLAALIDQLLAGNSDAPTTPAATLDPNSAVDLAGLLDTTAAPSATPPVPEALNLLADLTDALSALDAALKSGEPIDPDLLKKLSDAADALAGMLGVQVQVPIASPTTSDTETVLDPLAAIASAPTTFTQPAPTDTDAPAPPALPALAALTAKLSDAARLVAAEAPDLAQKLAAIGNTLTAAQASPDLLAKLSITGNSSGADIDRLVQALLDRATQTAAPAVPILKTPEPLLQPSVIAQAVAATPDPDAAAVKLAIATKAPDPSDAGARTDAKLEIKIPAAATPASDVPDNSPAPVTNNAAPVPTAPLARTVQAAYQPIAAQASTLPQLAFEMVRQFHQGQSRFTVRLDPPELGRVDVRMHVDAAGNVNARLTVERSETLDMFQRDQKTLERALTQAGLDSNKTNLEFALRQNPFSMGSQQGQQSPYRNSGFSLGPLASEESELALPAITLYRGTVSAGGVNLYV